MSAFLGPIHFCYITKFNYNKDIVVDNEVINDDRII